jgi:MinD superfamily P-loop ATPase
MKENESGEWFISQTRFGPLVHAKLGIAEENSGKLVSLVRKHAQALAESQKKDWVIIDGPPGIGCPVIASLSGIDCAVVVTEPTLSGLHDAKRVIEVARHFKVPVRLVINKYDLNSEMSQNIEDYCRDQKIAVAGKIRFDRSIVDSMVAGKTIMEGANERVRQQIINIWEGLQDFLKKDGKDQ